jgi:glycosyltransferase involved in cell wall biosynthesis
MRLCIAVNRYPVVTETFVYEPIRWLEEAGHRVDVLATFSGSLPGSARPPRAARIVGEGPSPLGALAGALRRPVRAAKFVASAFPHRGASGYWLTAGLDWARLPEVRRADAILAHFGPMGVRWLSTAAFAGKPLAVYFHGYDVGKVLAASPREYEALFQSGAALLTNSAYLGDRLVAAGAPAAAVEIVPLGVDPAIAGAPATGTPGETRVVTVARLVPKKGLRDSITAFARIPPAGLGAGLSYHIIGDGPQRAELAAHAAALGVADRVRFHGFLPRPDTLGLLRTASVMVLASVTAESGDTEGTPVALLEAAMMGLPIVATAHAGIPEILPESARREGYLVPEGSVEGLMAAIERIVRSPAAHQDWGRACHQHVRSRHSADAFVTSLVGALSRHRDPPRP